jgi:hypothetical protein
MTEHPRADWLVEKHREDWHHWPVVDKISGEPWDRPLGQYRVQLAVEMFTTTSNNPGVVFLGIFKEGVNVATVDFTPDEFSDFVTTLARIDAEQAERE